jgi:hypothetical protein
MPFVLLGVIVLGAAASIALFFKSREDDAAPGAGPALGATTRAPDPPAPAGPITDFQTVSSAEAPSNTVFDDRANELPDKFNSSGAATFAPIGVNIPEDPFLGMASIPGADRALGYAVDDMTPQNTGSMFVDDIEYRADTAFAPGSFAGGLVPESLK